MQAPVISVLRDKSEARGEYSAGRTTHERAAPDVSRTARPSAPSAHYLTTMRTTLADAKPLVTVLHGKTATSYWPGASPRTIRP